MDSSDARNNPRKGLLHVFNRRVSALTVASALVLLPACLAHATDYYVDVVNGSDLTGDGSQGTPWAHITHALTQVTAPATIHVAPGIYDTTVDGEGFSEAFPIQMQDGVSLVSEAGAASTVIHAQESGGVIECRYIGSETRLEGFTITGANAMRGGIYCDHSSLTIRDNTIEFNQAATVGGGLYCEDGSELIEANRIRNNTAGYDGGGICLSFSGAMVRANTIEGNQVVGQAAASGGGIYSSYSEGAVIERNVIIGNLVYRDPGSGGTAGSGIYVHKDATITGNVVAQNILDGDTEQGGGMYLDYMGGPVVNNTIWGNQAETGGGIYLSSSDRHPRIVNNIIAENTAYGIHEGSSSADPEEVSYNLFYSNGAGHYWDENQRGYGSLLRLELMVAECRDNLEGNPLLVNGPAGDYHLQAGSPSINAGTNDGALTMDIDGEPRPVVVHTDVGADEYADVPPGDTTPPTFAGVESAVGQGSSVRLSWSPASDPSLPIVYHVYTANWSAAQNFAVPDCFRKGLFCTVEGLTNGTPYYFVVRALDFAGNEDTNTVELMAIPAAVDYYVDVVHGSDVTGDGSQANPWAHITPTLLRVSAPTTIHVAPGTYNTISDAEGFFEVFPIQMQDGVSLVSDSGAASTIIDAQGTDRVIQCVDVGSETVLKGFTITGGQANIAGGICCVGSSLTIRDNTIQFNQAEDWHGGGIYCQASSVTIRDNTIEFNQAGSCGGGLYCEDGSELIEANWIGNNTAGSGGGIYLPRSRAIVRANTIECNQARGRAGGIWSSGSQGTLIERNVIISNVAGPGGDGGAGGMYVGYNAMISGNVVAHNIAEGGIEKGGGMYLYNVSGPVVNNTIWGNEAHTGGGIFLSVSDSHPRIVNNIIAENTAYGIHESSTSADPQEVSYNLFCANGSGHYWDENLTGYDSVAALDTAVAECANNLEGDPVLCNPGGGDFHLLAGSPCIDSGRNTGVPLYGNVTVDFEGQPRGMDGDGLGAGSTGDGSDYDIGADEAGIPTTPDIMVTPASPYTEDPLVCTVTEPSIVISGEPPQYEYVWSNGTDTITHAPTPDETDILSSAFTAKDQTWTCSVRGYDGFTYSDAATDQTTVLNTPPGSFNLSMPTVRGTNSNLRCWILDKSPDPDGDVTFEADWYYRQIGEPTWTPSPAGYMDTSYDWTQVDNDHTSAGQEWYCAVTLKEDDVAVETKQTEPCEITPWGTEPSYISLGVSPTTATLGESVTASGQIFPTPEPGADVFFESVSPSGVISGTFPEGLVIPGALYLRTFVPTEASEGRSPWALTASWGGDPTYMPASSTPVTFTVLKAEPTLAVELNASSAPLNYAELEATATISAAIPQELEPLLQSLELKLWMKKPDGSSPTGVPLVGVTDGDGVVVFGPADFDAAGIVFDEPGTWQFQVEFEGDDNFRPGVSTGYDNPESVRLTIKDRAGYAILVLGQLDEYAEGHIEHAKTSDYVYWAFRDRGFADEDILYLRGDAGSPPDPAIEVDDTTPTEAEVQWAIETWAQDKMNGSPAPLYVVFVGHGSRNRFYVFAWAYDDTDWIGADELDAYLNTLEAYLVEDASDEDIVFLYGGCHSASFIDEVSAPYRTVVTSCLASEISHRGVVDPADGIRDGELFVTEFFRNAREGKTLKESFELASDVVREYTYSRSNGTAGVQTQHPLLDDNADGEGTSGELSYMPGLDEAVAHELILGYGVNAGDSVGWIAVTPTVTLAEGDPAPTLEARPTDGDPGHEAWVEVKTPAYDGSTLADPSLPEFQQVVDMPTFDATDFHDGWYRWMDFSYTFDMPGTYQVFYYVRDAYTGEVSTYMLTTVYRAAPGNHPPDPVVLETPPDGMTVSTSTLFAWAETTDPDGDPVQYRLEASLEDTFPDDPALTVVKEGLTGRMTLLREADGLQDLSTYYWRVIPVDPYGASPDNHEMRTIHTNFGTDTFDGWIWGSVTDKYTGAAIPYAVIDVPALDVTTAPDAYGEYYFEAMTRTTYSVTVSASGYVSHSVQTSIASGSQAMLNFQLEPAYVDGDWIFNPANGHWYKLTSPLTWAEAQALAESWDAYLTTVNEELEDAWVHGTFGPFGDCFIGLYDTAAKDTFAWVNGETASYRNWATLGDSETYGVVSASTGTWYSVDAAAVLRAVAETDVGRINHTGPSGATVAVGEPHTFSVEVRQPIGDVTYQWLRYVGSDWELIPGANGPCYTIESVQFEDEGSYACEVSDAYATEQTGAAYLDVVGAMPGLGALGLGVLWVITALTAAQLLRRRGP